MLYKIPLILTPQPEGGYTVTCPILPELITEGDTIQEAISHAQDAFKIVLEVYQELGRSIPKKLQSQSETQSPICLESFIEVKSQ